MKGKRVSKAEALAECLEAARQGERALMSRLDRYPRMRQALTALVLVDSVSPPSAPTGRIPEDGPRGAKAAVLSRLGHFEDRRHGKAGVA